MKIILIFSLFFTFLSGCQNSERTVTEPQSFLQLNSNTEEKDSSLPIYFIIDHVTNEMSVLENEDDESLSYYEIDYYSEENHDITVTYNGVTIKLQYISENLYRSDSGHLYERSKILEDK